MNINDELIDVKLHLNKIKTNETNEDIKIKKKKILNNRRKRTEENDYLGTKSSNHNMGVKSMNELNNILIDFKDKLTVLKVTQNTSYHPLRTALNINNNNLFNKNI